MRPLFLIMLISIWGVNSLAAVEATKTYQGKPYPIDSSLLKKLHALGQKIDQIQSDIENLSLSPEANYQINEIEHIFDLVNALLNLEATHAEAGQFNEPALQNIEQQISGDQSILKKIPDQCLVDMQEPGVFPEEHTYLGKIKDISIETDQLLGEIVRELAAFK